MSQCKADISNALFRKAHSFHDSMLTKQVIQNKQTILMIEYQGRQGVSKKAPSAFDMELVRRIESTKPSHYVPTQLMMFKEGNWGDMFRSGYHFGISHAHHFWTRRNLLVLSDLFDRASRTANSHELRYPCTSFAVKTGIVCTTSGSRMEE